jgi:hypothetical protein
VSKEPPKPKSAAPAPADELKTQAGPTGRVTFDERGNAVWEWSIKTGEFDRNVSTGRLQKLENPTLSLAADAPTPSKSVEANPLGAVKGYNPYNSGKLGSKKEQPRKRDLKRLSEWIALRKQAAKNQNGGDEGK